MKRLAALLPVLLLAACASMSSMQGEQVVNERLAVDVPQAWNKVTDRFVQDPYETWTQEGLPLDHLRFWGGVRPGQPLMIQPVLFSREPDARHPRGPTFPIWTGTRANRTYVWAGTRACCPTIWTGTTSRPSRTKAGRAIRTSALPTSDSLRATDAKEHPVRCATF